MYSQRLVRREIVRVQKLNIRTIKRSDYNLPKNITLDIIRYEALKLKNLRTYRKSIKPFPQDPLIQAKFNRKIKLFKKYISFARFRGNYIDCDKGDMRYVADYNSKESIALVKVDSWINYSRRYGTWVKMSGLVLKDKDSGQFRFLRVGPDITNIDDALSYIKPSEVKKAEKEGKKIIRQGDIYFIPQKTWNLSKLAGTNHKVIKEKNKVLVCHETHGNLTLETPHKALQQIIVANVSFRRGGGRISGHAD